MRLFYRGDLDGFFGLALDNLVQLLLIDALCRTVLDFPADESFLGASAAFRQLHNDGEPASFSNAHNALFKVLDSLPEALNSVRYAI